MVFSYWIKALSRKACDSCTFDLRRPAVKIGCVTCGVKFQTALGPLNKLDSCVPCPPRNPVRLICGKYDAFATPISAFAAIRDCSVARMSGRRSKRAEGKPEGTAGGLAF